MTPRQLNIAITEYAKRRDAENKQLIMQAYLISSWVWMKPRARHSEFQRLVANKKPKKAMTDDQMYAQVKALNAVFGGQVVGG